MKRNNGIKVFENLISKDRFMELHMKSNLKPVMVNMNEVKAVRAVEDGCILFLGNGYEDCTVREDYYDVKALLKNGIILVILLFLLLEFLGITDDRAIVGFSD